MPIYEVVVYPGRDLSYKELAELGSSYEPHHSLRRGYMRLSASSPEMAEHVAYARMLEIGVETVTKVYNRHQPGDWATEDGA